MADYCRILGVDQNASREEVKRAYRDLALRHHPDRSTSPGATEKFQEINDAYKALSDPVEVKKEKNCASPPAEFTFDAKDVIFIAGGLGIAICTMYSLFKFFNKNSDGRKSAKVKGVPH